MEKGYKAGACMKKKFALIAWQSMLRIGLANTLLIAATLEAGTGASVTVLAQLLDNNGNVIDSNAQRNPLSASPNANQYVYHLHIKSTHYDPASKGLEVKCTITASTSFTGNSTHIDKTIKFHGSTYTIPLLSENQTTGAATPWDNISLHLVNRVHPDTKLQLDFD